MGEDLVQLLAAWHGARRNFMSDIMGLNEERGEAMACRARKMVGGRSAFQLDNFSDKHDLEILQESPVFYDDENTYCQHFRCACVGQRTVDGVYDVWQGAETENTWMVRLNQKKRANLFGKGWLERHKALLGKSRTVGSATKEPAVESCCCTNR